MYVSTHSIHELGCSSQFVQIASTLYPLNLHQKLRSLTSYILYKLPAQIWKFPSKTLCFSVFPSQEKYTMLHFPPVHSTYWNISMCTQQQWTLTDSITGWPVYMYGLYVMFVISKNIMNPHTCIFLYSFCWLGMGRQARTHAHTHSSKFHWNETVFKEENFQMGNYYQWLKETFNLKGQIVYNHGYIFKNTSNLYKSQWHRSPKPGH